MLIIAITLKNIIVLFSASTVISKYKEKYLCPKVIPLVFGIVALQLDFTF